MICAWKQPFLTHSSEILHILFDDIAFKNETFAIGFLKKKWPNATFDQLSKFHHRKKRYFFRQIGFEIPQSYREIQLFAV